MTVEELGKIEELEKQIASLQEEIRKLKEVNEKKELKPHRVNEGFAYYYINSDGIIYDNFDDYHIPDTLRYQYGNYYCSKSNAIRDMNELKIRNRIRQFHDVLCEGYQFKQDKCNYYVLYSLVEMKYITSWNRIAKEMGTIYFDTEEHARQVYDILNAELKEPNVQGGT